MENNKLYLNILIKGLKLFSIGVFNPNIDKPTASRLHSTIHVATWICVMTCIIGGYIDDISFDAVVFSFAVIVNMSLSMTKYIVFRLNRITVHNLIKLIEIEAASRVGTDIHIKKSMKDTMIMLRNYVMALVICTVMYLGKDAFLDKTEAGDTKYWEMMHLYLPYDFVVYKRFGIFRIVITLLAVYHAYCQVFLDVLSASLFTHLGRQFQAVADLFVNIPYADKEASKIRLGEAIDYHQLLLRYSADLQRMYNVAFFVQLAGCCLPLCLCMLLVVNNMKSDEGNLVNVISPLSFLVIVMYPLFLYTRVADVIKERALLVSEGVYLSDWYLASPSMRRELSWIIAHAQQPINYTALGIFPITISTFSQIMRGVYGACSLLTNVD